MSASIAGHPFDIEKTTSAMRDRVLEILEEFGPKMGRSYASRRNFDLGPGRHSAVSMLSPFVRRRVVTEEELVRTAIREHGFDGAEKFIQEVFWRTYFKGWLERRPSIWCSYRTGLAEDLRAIDDDRRKKQRVEIALAGTTGIACFDAWVEELVETGYLHNHARMWFASIWIFTLGLPWHIGADFFFRHLLDGDPASNTLGWRWVAGLHTRGKAYQAKAWNIAKYTQQRFQPADADLANVIEPLDATEPQGLPPPMPVPEVHAPEIGVPTALLITEEDCCLEAFSPKDLNPVAVATMSSSNLRSQLPVSETVKQFEADALADAASRLNVSPAQLTAGDPSELARWAKESGVRQIAMANVPQGPLHDWMKTAAPALSEQGIAVRQWRRNWDEAVWPYATAGFFKVKQQIPRILQTLEIT